MLLDLTALRSGEVDLIDYVGAKCDTIECTQQQLSILVEETYSRQHVLARARALLEQYPEPATRPALFGVTLGIKDIIDIEGIPTRYGSALPADLQRVDQASAVTKLLVAGAVLIGKTQTAEFACTDPPPTRNPNDPSHTPGGSSSGSAAGIRAGYFDLSLGTQTVGSVIRPAAYCGVVGVKPTFGRIQTDGVFPFSKTVDTLGWFCDSTELLATVAAVLFETSEETRATEETRGDVPSAQVTYGIPQGPYLDQADDAALTSFEDTIKQLQNAGLKIKRCDVLGTIADINQVHETLIAGEFFQEHIEWFEEYASVYRALTLGMLKRGKDVSLAKTRVKHKEIARRIRRELEDNDIDAWLAPAATGTAPLGLGSTGNPIMNLPWTASGLPAITLPSDKAAGLPYGLQIVGRFAEDEKLFRFAADVSRHLPLSQDP